MVYMGTPNWLTNDYGSHERSLFDLYTSITDAQASCTYNLLHSQLKNAKKKSSRIFLIRIAAARIKLCRYFAVAVKNPRDYNSYAVQQLQLAGRFEQGAVS
jgi:hypothetical protein